MNNLNQYCEKIQFSILKYCYELQQQNQNQNQSQNQSQSQNQNFEEINENNENNNDDSILSIIVGETFEWCKYEAFYYGFEEIIRHEKLYLKEINKYEELKYNYEILQQENQNNLNEIIKLKKNIQQNEEKLQQLNKNQNQMNSLSSQQSQQSQQQQLKILSKDIPLQKQNPNTLNWNYSLTNQENRSKFPIINLNEI